MKNWRYVRRWLSLGLAALVATTLCAGVLVILFAWPFILLWAITGESWIFYVGSSVILVMGFGMVIDAAMDMDE